jgi:hypothetical protein
MAVDLLVLRRMGVPSLRVAFRKLAAGSGKPCIIPFQGAMASVETLKTLGIPP